MDEPVCDAAIKVAITPCSDGERIVCRLTFHCETEAQPAPAAAPAPFDGLRFVPETETAQKCALLYHKDVVQEDVVENVVMQMQRASFAPCKPGDSGLQLPAPCAILSLMGNGIYVVLASALRQRMPGGMELYCDCLLYTSDAADE